jgi:hypothetical protein
MELKLSEHFPRKLQSVAIFFIKKWRDKQKHNIY